MSNTHTTESHARIERIPTGWVIRYLDGPLRSETLALFGTASIPLPFTAEATLELVTQTLESAPGVTVDLDGRVTFAGVAR